ncbi:MAG: PhoH family protein [Candidatus Delongbacteria bacterium]|jgi:PhoH-like ATPase|nr:PhoH family protein [Candidatus Delongbacteria bacterium]
MSPKKKKIFVLDTNVLLHDFNSIFKFQENDIVLPIVVLEELDHFKKGNDLINFHAREFTRVLDNLSGDKETTGGIELGDGLGKLYIETGKPFSSNLINSFPEHVPDHRILAIAEYLKEKKKTHQVILVTKDINLRMKAKSLGLKAQDYQNDKVTDIDLIQSAALIRSKTPPELIGRLYDEPEGVPFDDFGFDDTFYPHQYFVMKNGSQSALAHYDVDKNVIERVEKRHAYGIEPRNAEQAFSMDALMRPEIQLVALTGKAGTGKTLLSLAAALAQRRDYQQIYLARPIVPLSNRDLGYLPGDAQEKIGPYMAPLFDNLSVIKHNFSPTSQDFQRIDDMLKSDKLVIEPLAYIRGRSLSRVFFIVDEAQNLTPHEVKTIITRAGEGTKIIFTGDIQQIDSPYLDLKSNGLSYLAEKMRGQNVFAHINLVKGERSPLAELASDLL